MPQITLNYFKGGSMMELDIKSRFIKDFSFALEHGSAAIFAGAGVSNESGYVNWKNLLRTFALDIRLDIDKESDLIAVAQYYKNSMHGRHSLNQELINQFTKKSCKNRYMNALGKLPIHSYWTTNYDTIIEDTLKQEFALNVDVKITQDNLAIMQKDCDAIVYKFHGDISQPQNAVLTKDDYEMFSYTHKLFITALQGDLISKTFLYIGYSFNDPNLESILSNIRVLIGENKRDHYCIMRSVQRNQFKSNEEYQYAKIKQELKTNDLLRYGIHTIFINEYDEIIELINKVYCAYIKNRVFIAGSCRNYGTWDKLQAYEFMYKLGFKLISNGYIVSSGFVEGVGPQVVNGALTAINQLKLNLEKYLQIKPLPLIDGSSNYMDSQAKQMFQNDMIAQAGVIIILFGNQYYNGKLCNSKGVLHDFDRAVELNKFIIPVGATGFTALDIQNKLKKQKNKYFYLNGYWDKLKTETDPEKLSNIIIEILERLC